MEELNSPQRRAQVPEFWESAVDLRLAYLQSEGLEESAEARELELLRGAPPEQKQALPGPRVKAAGSRKKRVSRARLCEEVRGQRGEFLWLARH